MFDPLAAATTRVPARLRWPLADDEPDAETGGQAGLFQVDELVAPQRGTGRLSGLEFLHVRAKRILNPVPASSSMPFRWTINVYRGCSHACVYCFARPTHTYLGLDAGADFDRRIVVKINAVERLRVELADPKWAGEGVAMGTNTDPYQRCEGKYRLTRGVVAALTEHANPFSILTKSPLVLRDADLLARAARVSAVTVNFSIGTLDEQVWRHTEPGTPNPRRRVEAMRQLAALGIRTGALIAPVLPGLSDGRDQLAEVVAAITGAGGRILGALPLHLRAGTREHYLGWLRERDRTLYERYLHNYRGGAYLDPAYGRWLTRTVGELTSEVTAARTAGGALPDHAPDD
jgi:DNA repair photolyase